MRNLQSSYGQSQTRRSAGGLGGGAQYSGLAGQNQGRYKGLTPSPGIVKFSMWKRENEIPKFPFHEYLLQKIREQDPGKIWLKDLTNGRTETFGSVMSSVSKIASGLNKIGFSKRDVICMYCSNYVEYWLMSLAAWTCGGCVMPVNCEMDVDKLEVQLIEAKAKFIVCDDYNIEDCVDILQDTDILKHVIVIGTEGKGQGCIPVTDLMNDDGKSPPPKPNLIWDRDIIYMPFTSAVGREKSKGIMHTNKSILSMFYSPETIKNHYLDQMAGQVLACGNWFFHMSGFYPVALAAIYGISVYFLSEYSDQSFLEGIVENRIGTASLYPWQIRILSQSPTVTRYDLACLKVILSMGGVLSQTIKNELLDRFPNVKTIREAYGLNECGIVTLTYPKEKKTSVTVAKMEVPDDHKMPVGYPNMYTQIKILGRLSKAPVEGPDEQGEICIKSPQTFIGFLGSRNNLKYFDSEGYYRTGDLGYYDGQGCVYFIDKIENLIHFWMYEVSPIILEARLLGSNNIVDAAVVGIPNKENGEVPRAFVVLKPGFEETEENLIGLMESRLQDHERIRGGLFFIQSIPRDENWKIMKDVLQAYKPSLAYENTEIESGTSLSKTIKKSPKKGMIKELEKQPNGTFVAKPIDVCPPSPRTKRTQKKVLVNLEIPPVEAQEIFGMRNRSRRSSMDRIQENVDLLNPNPPSPSGSLKPQTSASGGTRRRASGSSRRGSADLSPLAPIASSSCSGEMAGRKTFSYWLKVKVQPKVLESVILTHPAVDDVSVVGHKVDGIGEVPRAYIILKTGYQATGEEICQFAHARLNETDYLRGGVVFVDKLPKDSNGKLMLNLAKFENTAMCVDKEFLNKQQKVQLK